MPASSSPRIVLHVGALKTASTYLQRRMGANLARLREHGIYLPVLPAVAQMAGNAKLLTTALNRRPTSMFQRAFPNIDVSKLDPAQIVAELLKGWRPARPHRRTRSKIRGNRQRKDRQRARAAGQLRGKTNTDRRSDRPDSQGN